MRAIVRRLGSFAIATAILAGQVSGGAAADLLSTVLATVAPVAVDDAAALAEDAPATEIHVLANDSDADGDGLTVVMVTQGGHGLVAIAGDPPVHGCQYRNRCGGTTVTYAPAADFNGTDTFTYTITDGSLGRASATVHVTIQARNDAPSFTIAGDQTAFDDAGPQTVVGFASGSAGPPDESGQTLSYVIDAFSTPVSDEGDFSTPGSNIFTVPPAISAAGDLTFTPRPEFGGIATVTVHLLDSGPNGNGDVNHSQEQSFLISIGHPNEPPVAVADGPYVVREGGTLARTSYDGVLDNDLPFLGALTAVLDTDVSHGTLDLHANGSLTYSPTALYVGSDSFTYHAHHAISGLDSSPVTVSITVYVNHAPVAVGDSATVVAPWDPVNLGVLANDDAANPDQGERLLVTHVSQPAHGTALIEVGGGDVLYRPTFGFAGTDSFSYTISDGVSTATATVHVTVLKDTSKPVTGSPSVSIAKQLKLGTSTVALLVYWIVDDIGTGHATSDLWQSVNGHPYVKIGTTTHVGRIVTATIGSTVRFRVRSTDRAGNLGNVAYSPTVKVKLYEETAASYLNPWQATSNAVYTGGHVAYTSTGGFDATFTATGRSFAWIGARSPTRGTAAVFVDGIQYPTVELGLFLNVYRAVLFTIGFPTSGVHTIRIVCMSPGERVDVDGFVVLQ